VRTRRGRQWGSCRTRPRPPSVPRSPGGRLPGLRRFRPAPVLAGIHLAGRREDAPRHRLDHVLVSPTATVRMAVPPPVRRAVDRPGDLQPGAHFLRSAREGPTFDRTSAGSTRAVLLMSFLGTAVIAAIAVPAAHVLAKQPGQVPQLVQAFALFAPGIAGTAVITNLSRVMFVIGRLKVAAAALAGSWLLVIVADVVLAELAPSHLVVAALALGNTIGQTVMAIPLVIITRRICGKAAVQGVGHAALAGLAAGAAGAAVGVTLSMAVPEQHKLEAFLLAIPAACGAIIAFGVVAYLLDNGDLRAVLAWVRRVTKLRS
jgi:hypothetical protein